jgi:hypothetical protein
MYIQNARDITLEERLRELSLFEYISVFGSILNQDESKGAFKERIPFKLWPRQAEACSFMESNKVMLFPKSRQKGCSELAAERALFTLFKHENTEGVAISIGEKEAAYFMEKRIWPKYEYLEKTYPGMFPKMIKKTKEEIIWEGNRIFKNLASSNTAAASMTLDFLIIDEAGGIDENRGRLGEESSIFRPILTNSMPALNQNKAAWSMIIGTSVPGSYYNQLVREAYESGNKTKFKYFFIGWWHQPGRDKEWYLEEESLQKDDMRLQHPTDMEDFFYIKDGLVFQHFDQQEGGRHIYDFEPGKMFQRKIGEKITRYKASWNNMFITSYDHGTNHPAVNLYALYDQYSDHLYIVSETFFSSGHGKSVEEINEAIIKRLALFPRKPDREIADGAIYNDVGIESVGTRFAKCGRKFKKAKKHDEAASRDLLNSRFRDNKIFIHSSCHNLIKQLRDYRWDPKSRGEKPIQRDDDAIDALRYLCAECKSEDHPKKNQTPVNYDTSYKRQGSVAWSMPTNSQVKLTNDWQAY